MAPFEPNLTLRYGPFVAILAFLLSGPMRFRIGLTEWSLALFALWIGLGAYWTGFPDFFQTNMLAAMSVAVIFVGVRAATRGGFGVRILVLAYVAGAFVGLVRTSSDFATPEAVRDTLNRVTQVGDLNVNYVAYAAVVAVLLIVLLIAEGSLRTRFWKVSAIAAAVGLCVGIVATQTRGALLSIVLLAGWLVVSRFGRPIKTVVVASAVVALAVCAGWADSALELLNVGDRAVFGLSGRTDLWATARSIWGRHVFEGSGFGAVRAVSEYGLPAHNTVLELGATLGLIGLILYFATVISAMRDRLGGQSRAERAFRLGAILVVLLPVMLSATWELTAAAWVAFALLSQPAMSRSDRTEAPAIQPDFVSTGPTRR